MADFCKQCSLQLFGEDLGDFKGLCKRHEVVAAICEGCGFIYVDDTGACVSPDCDKHGTNPKRDT